MSFSESPLPTVGPDGKPFKIQLDDAILRNQLDPLAFEVLRHGGTERAFTGEYTDTET